MERRKSPCSLGIPALLISQGESKLVMDHRVTLAKGNQKLYIQKKGNLNYALFWELPIAVISLHISHTGS